MSIFDSHFHIFEPSQPRQENQGYTADDYSCQTYLKAAKQYGFTGGALVTSSFQANSNEALIQNLSKLPASFVGVAALQPTATDEEISRLHKAGVRAIRFNLHRLGMDCPHKLVDLAARVHSLREWHTELYVESTQLSNMRPLLYELPSFSIDHLGVTTEGLSEVFNLVEQGARIKVSGFGRLGFDQVKLAQVLTEIHAINPNALIFGSDLPCVRSTRGFQQTDIDLIKTLFDENSADRILCRNALNFYRIESRVSTKKLDTAL
jgi:predicted TIM-barrel fold metal-dependent hydrolase